MLEGRELTGGSISLRRRGRLWRWGKVVTVKDKYASRGKSTMEKRAGFPFSTVVDFS